MRDLHVPASASSTVRLAALEGRLVVLFSERNGGADRRVRHPILHVVALLPGTARGEVLLGAVHVADEGIEDGETRVDVSACADALPPTSTVRPQAGMPRRSARPW